MNAFKHVRPASQVLLSVLLLCALSPMAWAHAEHGQAAGFLTGFMHPIGGLDHVLAMIAVGLWGAVLCAPAIWLLPIAFPLMMAFGGVLGLMGIPLPGVEIGIALSAVVIGAMVLLNVRLPLAIAVAMVGVFAIFHGHAHGTELPDGGNALLYSIGFVVGTGMLHCVGIAIGALHTLKFGAPVVRGAGAAVVAGGMFFLWQALFA